MNLNFAELNLVKTYPLEETIECLGISLQISYTLNIDNKFRLSKQSVISINIIFVLFFFIQSHYGSHYVMLAG